MENLNSYIENEVLWQLLANPTDINYSQIFSLQLLVDDFPQSGILRALRVTKNDDQNVKHAVAYFSPAVLYKLVHADSDLATVTPDRVAYIDAALSKLNRSAGEFIAVERLPPADLVESHINDQPAIETPAQPTAVEDYNRPVHTETAPAVLDQPVLQTYIAPIAKEQAVNAQQVEAAGEIVQEQPAPTEDKPVTKTDIYHDPLDEMEFRPFLWGDGVEKEADEIAQATKPVDDKQEEHHAEIAVVEDIAAVTPANNLPAETESHLPVVTVSHEELKESNVPAADMSKPSHENEKAEIVTQEKATDEIIFIPKPQIAEHAAEMPGHAEPRQYNDLRILPGIPNTGHEIVLAPPLPEKAAAEVDNMPEEGPANDVYNYTGKTEYFHRDISDEIVSIEDINLEQLAAFNAEFGITNQNETETPEQKITETAVNPISATDHFILEGGIAQNDAFEQDTSAGRTLGVTSNDHIIYEENGSAANTHADTQEVTNYNDDKLPYSFMWWLDRTRKKYASTYQPYVKNTSQSVPKKVKKAGVDELQQQYVESIYSVAMVNELEKSGYQKSGDVPWRKEDKIIQRFIQAGPQIQHSGATKLDNENKAKKSSEDLDEFVTETLARIYTEQMLYQKAIVTYKKLMLKIPEKSLYFAGQIEELEKKIF